MSRVHASKPTRNGTDWGVCGHGRGAALSSDIAEVDCSLCRDQLGLPRVPSAGKPAAPREPRKCKRPTCQVMFTGAWNKKFCSRECQVDYWKGID